MAERWQVRVTLEKSTAADTVSEALAAALKPLDGAPRHGFTVTDVHVTIMPSELPAGEDVADQASLNLACPLCHAKAGRSCRTLILLYERPPHFERLVV
jgi:hypothetical protein